MAFWNRRRKENDKPEGSTAKGATESPMQSDSQEKLKRQIERRIAIFKGQRPDSDDYGYSLTNPICTSTISDSTKYLSRLFTESGEKMYWVRTGAYDLKECNGVASVIVDRYQLYLNGDTYAEIYICPYAHSGSYTPRGLVLVEESDRATSDGNLEKEAEKKGWSIEDLLQIQRLKYALERMKQEREEKERLELEEQAAQVRKDYAQFDLDDSLHDETFSALLGCGVEMKRAYEYIQRDTLFCPCVRQEMAEGQRLTADDYYEIMREIEDAAREHFTMPPIGFDYTEDAARRGLTVPQVIEYYKLKKASNEDEWKRLQQKMMDWASEAVTVQQKYPKFDLRTEYADGSFKRILMRTTMMTAYEVVHFKELYRLVEKDVSEGKNEDLPTDVGETYFRIFEVIYHKALSSLLAHPIVKNAEFELLPAMLVVVDYSCLSANKDRHLIVSRLIELISGKYLTKKEEARLLDERVDFYGSIIRGRTLRAEWLQGQVAMVKNERAIVRCVTALGDILINPECANDYDNAPSLLCGVFEMTEFAGMYIKEIMPLFVELFKVIYDAED